MWYHINMENAHQQQIFRAVMERQASNRPNEYKGIEPFDRTVILAHYFHEAGVPVKLQVYEFLLPSISLYRCALEFQDTLICERNCQGLENIANYEVDLHYRVCEYPKDADRNFKITLSEEYTDYMQKHPQRLTAYQDAQRFIRDMIGEVKSSVLADSLSAITPPSRAHSRRSSL